jgi:hypothetical protein
MAQQQIETDYLVVGAGAGGMAFTDALIAACDRKVVIADRRHAPGGHWLDAYPFVRLHQPSAYYGVASMPLGHDAIDQHGPNRGFYEVASGADVCAYFERVMDALLACGRVRYYPLHDYELGPGGEHCLVSRLSGERRTVAVAHKLVDATYLQTSVPATHVRGFEVADGVRCVPINALARLERESPRYVVLGAGKTALDACIWLLDQRVPPARIRWVKPREAWLIDRQYAQPHAQLATMLEGVALQAEAAAAAESVSDLFVRLEASGQLMRVDPRVTPTMYRCASVSMRELALLRSIDDVIRLGRVERIERQRLTLQQGSVEARPDDLYIDCSAVAFTPMPMRPMFERDRITLQPMRTCQPSFNSALIGRIEATRDDLDAKNQLCPPNPYPTQPEDWMRMFVTSNMAQFLWMQDRELADWIEATRLNPGRGSKVRRHEPELRAATGRIRQSMGPGLQNLVRLQQQPA